MPSPYDDRFFVFTHWVRDTESLQVVWGRAYLAFIETRECAVTYAC